MAVKKTLQRLFTQGHVWLYRRTGGRLFTMGHRLVLVNTTGAKSHEPRTSPLYAFPHGQGWVVVAAFGRDHSPAWYHNMVANPEVVVEHEPSYEGFQRKTERTIPVMILEPADVEQAVVQGSTSSTG